MCVGVRRVSLAPQPSRYDQKTAEGGGREGTAVVKEKGETSEMNLPEIFEVIPVKANVEDMRLKK